MPNPVTPDKWVASKIKRNNLKPPLFKRCAAPTMLRTAQSISRAVSSLKLRSCSRSPASQRKDWRSSS
jgi:hypothetical protein